MSSPESSQSPYPRPGRRGPGLIATLAWVIFIAVLAGLPWLYPPDGAERSTLAQFIGRFHPLIVHFPIALLLVVPLLEIGGLFSRGQHFRDSAGFVLWLGTLGTLVSTLVGWALARNGGYAGDLVNQHMWGGVVLSLVCLVAVLLRGIYLEKGFWSVGVLYGPVLLAAVALMSWTAHQGGQLTHGERYLTEHMPARLRDWMGLPVKAPASPRSPAAATAAGATTKPAATLPAAGPASSAATTLVEGTPASGPASTVAAGGESFYAARIAPAFDRTCNSCHNANKKKGKLRLDTYELIMAGGDSGPAIKPGDAAGSELYRRITLPHDDEEFMPTDGKKPLSAEETKWVELWIAAGASETAPLSAFTTAPAAPPPPAKVAEAPGWAPDFRARQADVSTLEKKLGVRLVARSQLGTDGLILRTASGPARCDDAALAALAPLADLIVDAELARTKITDAGLASIGTWQNLRRLDLTQTGVTSAGAAKLEKLGHLEYLNFTDTSVDAATVEKFRQRTGLRVYGADAQNVTNEVKPGSN